MFPSPLGIDLRTGVKKLELKKISETSNDDTCCHFPFKYKDKTYTKADGCTKADDFLPWCPTLGGDVSWTHNDFAGREKDDRYCDETCMKGKFVGT